jgi:sugar phosphate isomerase/epimerase
MDVKMIAAQLYTLREFTKTPDDICKTLKKVKDIGYESVQVSGMGEIEPKELKSLADSFGMHICATHTPYERFINDLENVISEHRLWNCDYVGLGAMPEKYRSGRQGYKDFIKEFSVIADEIYQGGLKFIYHNHSFEFEKFGGITGMDILFSETDPDTFGFELDTYWIQAGGSDPVDWIRKVEGRMDVVHFKDMGIKDNKQVFAEIGQGNLNWDNIIEACGSIGVKWYVIEQDICQGDPFQSLKTSYDYLYGRML